MNPLFSIGDEVQMYVPDKGYKVGKIVDKIPAQHKPDLFLVQKWKLFKMPLNRSKFNRWVVQVNNSTKTFVFPDNPLRTRLFTVYLTGDVRVEKLVSPAEYRRAFFAGASSYSIGGI